MSVPAAALAPIAVVVVAFEIFSLLDRVGLLPPFASRPKRGRRIGLLAGRNGGRQRVVQAKQEPEDAVAMDEREA